MYIFQFKTLKDIEVSIVPAKGMTLMKSQVEQDPHLCPVSCISSYITIVPETDFRSYFRELAMASAYVSDSVVIVHAWKVLLGKEKLEPGETIEGFVKSYRVEQEKFEATGILAIPIPVEFNSLTFTKHIKEGARVWFQRRLDSALGPLGDETKEKQTTKVKSTKTTKEKDKRYEEARTAWKLLTPDDQNKLLAPFTAATDQGLALIFDPDKGDHSLGSYAPYVRYQIKSARIQLPGVIREARFVEVWTSKGLGIWTHLYPAVGLEIVPLLTEAIKDKLQVDLFVQKLPYITYKPAVGNISTAGHDKFSPCILLSKTMENMRQNHEEPNVNWIQTNGMQLHMHLNEFIQGSSPYIIGPMNPCTLAICVSLVKYDNIHPNLVYDKHETPDEKWWTSTKDPHLFPWNRSENLKVINRVIGILKAQQQKKNPLVVTEGDKLWLIKFKKSNTYAVLMETHPHLVLSDSLSMIPIKTKDKKNKIISAWPSGYLYGSTTPTGVNSQISLTVSVGPMRSHLVEDEFLTKIKKVSELAHGDKSQSDSAFDWLYEKHQFQEISLITQAFDGVPEGPFCKLAPTPGEADIFATYVRGYGNLHTKEVEKEKEKEKTDFRCKEKIKPLSKKQKDAVKNTSSALVDFFNINIETGARLAPRAWLNDDIINFYTKLLNNRTLLRTLARDPGQRQIKYYCFSTFMATKLLQGKEFNYKGIKKWSSTACIKILNLDKLFMPVNEGENHWTLAVVNFHDKKFQYYDSIYTPNGRTHEKLFRRLRKYVTEEAKTYSNEKVHFLDEWTDEYVNNAPQQGDSNSDCGVFACKYMDYIIDNCPLNFTTKQIPYFRKRMAWEIKNITLDTTKPNELKFEWSERISNCDTPEDQPKSKKPNGSWVIDYHDSPSDDPGTPEKETVVYSKPHDTWVSIDPHSPSEDSIYTGKPKQRKRKNKLETQAIRDFEFVDKHSLLARRNTCFFNPEKSCGSFVRTGLGYTRRALEEQAVACGISERMVSRLTMDTLCQLLRTRYFEQQQRNFLVEFFGEQKVLPGYDITWEDIERKPAIRLLDLQVYDLLLPVPPDLHVLQRFEQDTESYKLTIRAAATLLSHPAALNNYKITVRKIIVALREIEWDLKTLIPDNNFLVCKMILRLMVSTYILSPFDYMEIHKRFGGTETCLYLVEKNTMDYAMLFKTKVLQYTKTHYELFSANYFVEFYTGALSLDFPFSEYLTTTKVDFIRSMTVFPITAIMENQVKMMQSLTPASFPLTIQTLAKSIQGIEMVKPQIEAAINHTLELLMLNTGNAISENVNRIGANTNPLQQVLQLLGRMWANAYWFGLDKLKSFFKKLLSTGNLKTLRVTDLCCSLQFLENHIIYTDYQAFLELDGVMSAPTRKKYHLIDWYKKNKKPQKPQNEYEYHEIIMSNSGDDSECSDCSLEKEITGYAEFSSDDLTGTSTIGE